MTIGYGLVTDADILGLNDGSVLKVGSNDVLLTLVGRQFDALMISDAGDCFSASPSQSPNSSSGAAAGTGGGSATFATIPTLGTYLAYTSPTSSAGHHFASGVITVNLSGLALAGELMYARAAMAAWARVANITFVETAGAAQITFTDDGDATNYDAYASTYWSGPTLLDSAEIHITQKWYNMNGGAGGATGVLNGYGFQTYVHELGHALGLGHAGPYNGSATYGIDNVWTNDSYQYSIMSYFDQAEAGTGASFSWITSAMMADIYGIQLLYGAPASNPGSHWFGYNPTVGAMFDLAQSDSFCMYSVDGIAFLDASLYNGAQTVNFNAGAWSSIKGLTNNVSLATNTHLTTYWGGSGTDFIYLTNQNTNDSVDGNGGSDTVYVSYAFGSGYSVLTGSTTIHLLLQGGAGLDTLDDVEFVHFSNGITVSTASLLPAPAKSVSHDFNNDDISDVLFRSSLTGEIGFYQLNSGGTLQGWHAIGGSNVTYTLVGTGDFNGDGVADILFRNNLNGDTGFYQLNSNGTLQGWHGIGASNTSYSVVGVGDFNGDGISDILYRNNSSGDTGFYQMNSNGTLQGWHSIGASSISYFVAGIGDFNGDGISDILYRNSLTGDTGFYQLNSNGTLQGWHGIGASSVSYLVAGVGDFNGDGVSDILYRNNFTGDTGFYQLNPNGTLQGWHAIGASSTNYVVVGVGDYNGDGVSDVLFRNNTSGDTGFYQLNSNGTLQGYHSLGVSSTTFSVF